MNKLDYCFHSHTSRCGHAFGEDEDFVKRAIEGDFLTLGVSDHVMLPRFIQPRMRGAYSLFEDYVSSNKSLKEKYKDKIQILLAFETEWYGSLYESYYRSLLEGDFDYLILGQHNVIQDGVGVFYGDLGEKKSALRRYREDLIAGMESGMYLYVCHPDLFMIWYRDFDDLAIETSNMIIDKALELDMPLEVNMGPSRWQKKSNGLPGKGCSYPWPGFWDLANNKGVKTTIGVDAHLPSDLVNSDFPWVLDFVNSRPGLKLQTRDDLLKRIEQIKNHFKKK